MNRGGFFISIIALLISIATQASQWSDDLKVKIDDVVASHFANQTQVGLVVGVIRQGEAHIWNYGETAKGSGATPHADSLFEIGSITKTFTTTLLALEVLNGRIAIDAQIETLWPELKGTDAGKITLEQLATHTSGLPRMPDNLGKVDESNPYRDYDENALLTFLTSYQSSKPVPAPYEYSNLGMGLLGFMLSEKLNQKPYSRYVEEKLLSPLGMLKTTVQVNPLNTHSIVQGYDSVFDLVPYWDFGALSGAGALKSSANEMMKYMMANLAPPMGRLGEAILLAQKPRNEIQAANGGGAGVWVGLAWESLKLGTHQVVTHSGATGGYRANLVMDPSERIGAFVLSNTAIAPDCLLAPVFEVPCSVKPWLEPTAATMTAMEGLYGSQALGIEIEVVRSNGHIGLKVSGQPKMRLRARSNLEFEVPDADAVLVFEPTGAAGVSPGFELQQGGQNFKFVRIK